MVYATIYKLYISSAANLLSRPTSTSTPTLDHNYKNDNDNNNNNIPFPLRIKSNHEECWYHQLSWFTLHGLTQAVTHSITKQRNRPLPNNGKTNHNNNNNTNNNNNNNNNSNDSNTPLPHPAIILPMPPIPQQFPPREWLPTHRAVEQGNTIVLFTPPLVYLDRFIFII